MPAPTSVTLRAYQVGFGDCLLLSVAYDKPFRDDARTARHMLIDFGSNRRPKGGPALADVAQQIHTHCEGQLDILVATHRHQDHISGFGDLRAASTIATLNPKFVVRPWTDDPAAPFDATGPVALGDNSRQFATNLRATHTLAERIYAANKKKTGNAANLAQLAALQIPNPDAIKNLQAWAGAATSGYVSAGDGLKLTTLMPGVTAKVLGPPTLEQVPKLTSYAGSSDQYWLRPSAALALAPLTAGRTSQGIERALAKLAQPDGLGAARWLIQHLDTQQTAQLLGIVRTFDNALNNTSVVLLLTIGTVRMLLAGDAQLENWSYTLGLIQNAKYGQLRDDLTNIDLYKVGHHGSRNATPKTLYDLWQNRNPAKPLVSVMSTMGGVYDTTVQTSVPRASLVTALKRRGALYSTESLTGTNWIELTADVTTPATFTSMPPK